MNPFNVNPYAAAGWYNPENPYSINQPPWCTPAFRQADITGALPTLNPTGAGGSLVFRYHSQYRDILNSTLLAPNGSDYLEIVTNNHTTYFRKKNATVLASIDWGSEPAVSISGLIDNLPVKRWIPHTPDGRRMMFSRDKKPFTWVTESRQISLYAVGSAVLTDILGSITRSPQCVTLYITSEAMQAGLLESAIVATVLLQSGRRLE